MSDILSKGSLFPEELVPGLIQKTTGASALAALCGATPIPFNGMKEFTFQLDKEVDIVAENGAKTKGGATVSPVTIVPIKIEYPATDAITAVAVGIVSGLAATGANQIVKQLGGDTDN